MKPDFSDIQLYKKSPDDFKKKYPEKYLQIEKFLSKKENVMEFLVYESRQKRQQFELLKEFEEVSKNDPYNKSAYLTIKMSLVLGFWRYLPVILFSILSIFFYIDHFYLGKANILKKLLSSSAANMQENIGISFIPEKYYPFFLNLIFFTFFILLFLRFRILLLISIFSLAGIFLAAYWDMQSKTFFPEALSFAYVALLVLTFFIGKR